MTDMASLWWMCALTFVHIAIVTGKHFGALSNTNFGLQTLTVNSTGCWGDPHGDRLKDLCDAWQGVECCLYRRDSCGLGLCLVILGGNGTSLRTVVPQLPTYNITHLSLGEIDLSDQQPGDTLCILSKVKKLILDDTNLEICSCLTQLTDCVISGSYDFFSVTNTTLQGLNHLVSLEIWANSATLSTDGMMQLQAAKELKYIRIYAIEVAVLGVWPLCLSQTHQGLYINVSESSVIDFANTLIPSRCNIELPLMAKTKIDLMSNSIVHVSDIATGWGFPSLNHFITSLVREDSTKFPITLDENPFTCDCRDLDLYRMLRDPRYNKHLANLANLTCKRPLHLRGRRFETLLESELDCDSSPLPLILGVPAGVTVLLAVSVLGFLFYNRILLYRWSGYTWHPWDRDECIGENKEFDVFVSHASEDEEWTKELIEELESRGFKVLFHKRDFEVGVTKIDNVIMAVDKSKRTICVLSPSFVASPWCSWEFITVFNGDMEEHQRRLLLIVKEKVAWESLSLAMQRYMRDFTYIDAESPYYMDNLLYSLPVKRLGEVTEVTRTGDGRDCKPTTSDSTPNTGHSSAGERTPLLQAV